jgi:hypothetical protein
MRDRPAARRFRLMRIRPPHENLSITSSSNLPRAAIADKANAGRRPPGAARVNAPPAPVIALLSAN